jgi:multidrug efflux pump subunit AcrB
MSKTSTICPLKTVGTKWVSVGDVGDAQDASQLQYNIVRIDGQKSAYIPIMKQGGDTNTIQVVNDVALSPRKLFDLPKQLKTAIAFDQSVFVKQALSTVMHEGLMGLVPHQRDDPDLSGKRAGHFRGAVVDSHLRHGHHRGF